MPSWKNKPLPPFCEHLGIEIVEWSDGHVVLEAEMKPEHCNNSGIPHGGFITTLIDVAATLPGVFCPNPDHMRRALTASLNTQFLGQAQSRKLRAVGRVTGAGRKIFHGAADVFDGDDNLIASGQAVCRYRSGSEGPEGQPFNMQDRLRLFSEA